MENVFVLCDIDESINGVYSSFDAAKKASEEYVEDTMILEWEIDAEKSTNMFMIVDGEWKVYDPHAKDFQHSWRKIKG